MTHIIRTRLQVAEDGTITAQPFDRLPPGEHDAEITVQPLTDSPRSAPEIERLIRELQDEVARLPVLDPRTPDEILGYNAAGLFD